MTDSGVYRCVARNEKGDSTAPVNLEVYGKIVQCVKCEMKLYQTSFSILLTLTREQDEQGGPFVGK